MGRLELAQRIRRARRKHHAAAHLRRGNDQGQRADAGERPRHHVGRADFDPPGHRGAEETVHPEDIVRRRNLVPGIFRTQRRLRRGFAANPRHRRWRQLRRQWTEDLDLRCSSRRLVHLLVRTDLDAPKHKGISYILLDMHSPGVTVRPLVQITGEASFNEVFFEDVRVPKKNLIGEKNQGWQVAIMTLMFDRAGVVDFFDAVGLVKELVELAKSLPADGHRAWDEPSVRQKLAEFACEATALKFSGYRQLTRRLKGLPPGPEGSVLKLGNSDLNLRMNKFAMEMLGPYGQLEVKAPYACDKGIWAYRMLSSRALTIAGGTNEVQHNIIGERVLGLPKG